ncbi:MAG: hypothetical protein K2P84_08175 [Undibacterium sp.]|nr:hypothetical protein [Undibacterium sp.]
MNLDLKGFSTKSSVIDKILNSLGILQLQEGIANFIQDAIERAQTSQKPLWSASGGDNAFILYDTADDAQLFVATLHGMSKQEQSESHSHRRMLFHSGATYGEIAYHAPNHGERVISLARSQGGGRGVTDAARLAASSLAGQFIVAKGFFEKLSLDNQRHYSPAFTLKEKHDTYRETRYVRYLTPVEAADIGDIGFPINNVIYPDSSWPIIWSLMVSGSSFHTINHLTPDKWEGNKIAKYGVSLLRNMIQMFPNDKGTSARRVFLLGDDEDVMTYSAIFALHEGVPIRMIRMSDFKRVMTAAVVAAGHKELLPSPFSLSTPLFQTDFHENRIVSTYLFVEDTDEDPDATYDTCRRLEGILITGSDASTQAAYVAAYNAIWDAADLIRS